MKKTIICLLLFSSSLAFAQQDIVGSRIIGISGKIQIAGLKGFGPRPELSFGKFYTSHFFVGVNSSLDYSNYGKRYQRLYSGTSPIMEGSRGSSFFAEGNVFAKYYLGEGRLRPFFYGELGMSYSLNKSGNSNSTTFKSSDFTPGYGLGAGMSWFADKNKRFLVEGLFTINNFASGVTVVVDNGQFYQQKPGFGQLRLGVSYLFKSKK